MSSLTKLSRSVENLVTFVTGAGSGMGKATAKVFADAGAKVIVSDINQESVDKVSREIQKAKGACLGQVLDITKNNEINKASQRASQKENTLNQKLIFCN